ncbi:MAG: glycoside hydrolase family 3 C-terminal domain-containing protein [Acetanaerobacterium sp.]
MQITCGNTDEIHEGKEVSFAYSIMPEEIRMWAQELPLTVPWIKANADAVIETFNSDMMVRKVLGEILFGETKPSGKLSISFPYHVGQLPVYYNLLQG